MGNIPLPALSIRPPEQIDPLQGVKNLYALKAMAGQQQLQQQQIQGAQLDNQQRQQDLATRQALNNAFASSVSKDESGNPTFDSGKLQTALASGPAAYKTPEVMEGITKFQQTKIDLQKSIADLQQKSADMIGGAASAVKGAGYDRSLAHGLLDSLPQSPQLNAIRAKIDGDPAVFKQTIDSAVANSPAQQKMQNDRDVANIRNNTLPLQQAKAWLQNNPTRPDGTPTDMSDYQKFTNQQQVNNHVSEETDPAVLDARKRLAKSEAEARQAVQDGDPNAAAQLLISGAVSPSQIISARKPEFAQKAFSAAAQLNPQWNAQKAEGDFQVAKSPANVAFFGSAKSLTDKGGTLDQLAQAAKDIPGNQIPVFNTIADAAKAATGDGPVAKYASILLGVSDDYSKVMGGGQGSDASRSQALKLIPTNASPEARAAAIEGIRGSVASQMNGRIGKNGVLQRMYGEQGSSGGDFFSNLGGTKR